MGLKSIPYDSKLNTRGLVSDVPERHWNGNTSVTFATASNWDEGIAPESSTPYWISFGKTPYSFAPAMAGFTVYGFRQKRGGANITPTGNISIGRGGVYGTGGNLTLSGTGAATLTLLNDIDVYNDGTGTITFNSDVQGVFSINKYGSSIFQIGGTTNTFSGGFNVYAGIGRLNGGNANLVCNVLSDGGTFGGVSTNSTGFVTGNIVINNTVGSGLSNSSSTGVNGTLTLTGNLSFGGSTCVYTVNSTATAVSVINVSGTVALGGVSVVFNAGITTVGTYNLIVATGTMSGTLPTIITNSTGKTLTLVQVGNTLQVIVT